MKRIRGFVIAEFIGATIMLTIFCAWLTHVIVCLSDERWGFLIAGALMFPIGIIHGIGIWLGFF